MNETEANAIIYCSSQTHPLERISTTDMEKLLIENDRVRRWTTTDDHDDGPVLLLALLPLASSKHSRGCEVDIRREIHFSFDCDREYHNTTARTCSKDDDRRSLSSCCYWVYTGSRDTV